MGFSRLRLVLAFALVAIQLAPGVAASPLVAAASVAQNVAVANPAIVTTRCDSAARIWIAQHALDQPLGKDCDPRPVDGCVEAGREGRSVYARADADCFPHPVPAVLKEISERGSDLLAPPCKVSPNGTYDGCCDSADLSCQARAMAYTIRMRVGHRLGACVDVEAGLGPDGSPKANVTPTLERSCTDPGMGESIGIQQE